MPDISETQNTPEREEDEANDDEEEVVADNLDKDKKHNSGTSDLEKVTDYAEDKEIISTGSELEDAIANIRKKQDVKTQEKLAIERELAKVTISKEDIDLIMCEMELPKERAERTLREHGGDVVQALTALVNS